MKNQIPDFVLHSEPMPPPVQYSRFVQNPKPSCVLKNAAFAWALAIGILTASALGFWVSIEPFYTLPTPLAIIMFFRILGYSVFFGVAMASLPYGIFLAVWNATKGK